MLQQQADGLLSRGIPEIAYQHPEMPHSANLGRWLSKYPDAVAVGDVRDYHLVFPDLADRLVPLDAGDRIDLGGTEFVILEAIIRDLVTSFWGYDTRRRALFPGDGFAYMHHHQSHECGYTAEELPDLPIPEFTAIFAEYALYWTRFTDMEPKIRQLETLLSGSDPIDVILPAHGCPILDPSATVDKVKEGLRAWWFSNLDGRSLAKRARVILAVPAHRWRPLPGCHSIALGGATPVPQLKFVAQDDRNRPRAVVGQCSRAASTGRLPAQLAPPPVHGTKKLDGSSISSGHGKIVDLTLRISTAPAIA